MGTKCEGLYRLFLFFGVFQIKNNEEIPSIWRHFGASKKRRNILRISIFCHIKLTFLKTINLKIVEIVRILEPKMGGPWSGQKTNLPERTMIFLVAPKAPQPPTTRSTDFRRSDPTPLA